MAGRAACARPTRTPRFRTAAPVATRPRPRPHARRWVRAFKRAGLLCASAVYLVDWVAQPWVRLAGQGHCLFGTQPGPELAALEAARRSGGSGSGGEDGACSASF